MWFITSEHARKQVAAWRSKGLEEILLLFLALEALPHYSVKGIIENPHINGGVWHTRHDTTKFHFSHISGSRILAYVHTFKLLISIYWLWITEECWLLYRLCVFPPHVLKSLQFKKAYVSVLQNWVKFYSRLTLGKKTKIACVFAKSLTHTIKNVGCRY